MEEKITLKNNVIYVFGPYRLDVAERRLLKDGLPVPLARKSFDLLLVMVEGAGSLKTREELIDVLWPRTVVEEQNLTVKVYALRRALGDEGEKPVYIETVRGMGYRFIAPVTVETPEGDAGHPAASGRYRRRRPVLAAAVSLVLVAAVGVATLFLYGRRFFSATNRTPTVAVLPFENLGTGKTDAFIASGIQDTILTRLAMLHGLNVISRTSSDAYASRPRNLRAIARELGATDVLEGSVQQAGRQLLINVQLIDARTDRHVWAATYQRSLDHLLGTEGDIARQVATSMLSEIEPREAKRLTRPPTNDAGAYLSFLRANYEADRVFDLDNVVDQNDAIVRTVGLYRDAIRRDPRFALAYANLAILESRAFWFNLGGHRNQRLAAARRDAKKALSLAPDLPQAYAANGFVAYYGSEDYAAALSQFRHAHELLPNNAVIVAAMAFADRRLGKWNSALGNLERAARLDPRNTHWLRSLADTYVMLRRYDEAIRHYDLALALEPKNYQAIVRKADVQLMTGRLKAMDVTLSALPAGYDPAGEVSILRFRADMFRRLPDKALADLGKAPSWITGVETISHFPKSLLLAQAWRLKGNSGRARRLYRKADRQLLAAPAAIEPHNADYWSAIGLVQAGMGHAAAAVVAGRRSLSLAPVSKDAFRAPYYLVALAQIYTMLDRPRQALKVVGRLLAMPAGVVISVDRLKRSPTWSPIRKSPAFGPLLEKYAHKPPAVLAAGD